MPYVNCQPWVCCWTSGGLLGGALVLAESREEISLPQLPVRPAPYQCCGRRRHQPEGGDVPGPAFQNTEEPALLSASESGCPFPQPRSFLVNVDA